VEKERNEKRIAGREYMAADDGDFDGVDDDIM